MRSAAGELGSVLGISNIKIPDMLSHKRCHGDSGILGCAEYELKMSNNDKKVSRRRLVRISFCSSCTSEAPQKMELGLAQQVRILLALLDAANGDGEIVSLMSVAMGFPGAAIGWAFSEWYKGGNGEISADSTIASLIIWFSASCVILILFIASRACSARRRSKLHGMLLILEQELENEQIAKRAHCIIR